MTDRSSRREGGSSTQGNNLPLWISAGAGAAIVLSGLYFNSKINALHAEIEELKKKMEGLPAADVIKKSIEAVPNHAEVINRMNNAMTTTFNATNKHESIIMAMERKFEAMPIMEKKLEKMSIQIMKMSMLMNTIQQTRIGSNTGNLLEGGPFTPQQHATPYPQQNSNLMFDVFDMMDETNDTPRPQKEEELSKMKRSSSSTTSDFGKAVRKEEPKTEGDGDHQQSIFTETKTATPSPQTMTEEEEEKILKKAKEIYEAKKNKQKEGK